MYTAHFGLNAAPFSITPDPHYLYLSSRHREALAHLLYGVNEGPGFVLLTGEVGTGKTTLCRSLIEQLPDTVDVALLLNPRLTPMELLITLFDELRIGYDPQSYTVKDFIDTLSSYLLTAYSVGRRTVVILDEAQNLPPEVLEQVRLLTNLETSSQKLLQIILVGQPELNTLLKRNNLRQLAQRITARYHLLPLSLTDTKAYINHRLAISGARSSLFTEAAMRLVYRYSKGIPRLINIICDRALLGGYVNNENKINPHIVRKAVKEVRGENISQRPQLFSGWVGMLIIALLASVLIWWWTLLPDLPFLKNPVTLPNISLSSDSKATLPVPTKPTLFAEPIIPTLNLGQLLLESKTESAFTTLFNLWELDYTTLEGDKACQRAATQKLACLLRTGTWNDLRRINRPAVIELITDKGIQHHLVVTRLQGDVVTLAISQEKSGEFPISEINQYWLGQFLLLWHPPTLPPPILKVGTSHESVIWIRKHLDIIEGIRSELHTLSPHFDYALKRRVIAFQRSQKLGPDGVAGEQTMLALQALVGAGPILLK
ncbi:AAA family ATPase [Candidatus Parabeggiatoa sp. HSG14]|uniref:ExeA family protein n=1 Tax=Candidatus Parabeggiatoa sp. HSG14 TaxID=3055593 RepID=UPI0025A6935F|nr:AAA family ATPase [Thiotrichales bacterium HSG14]